MKVILSAHVLWNIIERCFIELERIETLEQAQRDTLEKNIKNDQCALTIIHQYLDDEIFEKVVNETIFKQV